MGVGEGVETQRLAWVTHTHEGKETRTGLGGTRVDVLAGVCKCYVQ
jgi:hypothetical protein